MTLALVCIVAIVLTSCSVRQMLQEVREYGQLPEEEILQ